MHCKANSAQGLMRVRVSVYSGTAKSSARARVGELAPAAGVLGAPIDIRAVARLPEPTHQTPR